MLQNIILPIVVAVVSSIPAGIFSSAVALNVLETKLVYLQDDVLEIQSLIKKVMENDKELAQRGIWMKYVDRELEELKEVEKEIKVINRKVDNLEKYTTR